MASTSAGAAADRPAAGLGYDVAVFLVGAAVHAPSIYNTQPWRFVYRPDGSLDLCTDHRRTLPATDPAGRELVISCGAALATLKLGIRWLGHRPWVRRWPDPGRPDLLARVGLGPPDQPRAHELKLFAAVLDRHTHRGPFHHRPVPSALLASLLGLADRAGCHATLIGHRHLPAVARLTVQAQRLQQRQPRIRAEAYAALRPAVSLRRDGVVMTAVAGGTGPGVLADRWTTPARPPAAGPARTAGPPPTLLLSTGTDEPTDWLRAGESLQYVLLHAATRRVYATIHTQPVEVTQIRDRLAGLAGVAYPQMLLQLGYTDSVPAAPRRPPAEVLTAG